MRFFRRQRYFLGLALVAIIGAVLGTAWFTTQDALQRYEAQLPAITYDRHRTPLHIPANARGHYVLPTQSLPPAFVSLLLQKEDQWFRYHPGIHPWRLLRGTSHYLTDGTSGGSSTLTQQLAKNLLGYETARSVPRKLHELLYAVSMELLLSKQDILTMYSNTVYLGNQTQGFNTASHAYFGVPLADTTYEQQLSLLATLSHPSTRHPWSENHQPYVHSLHRALGNDTTVTPAPPSDQYQLQHPTAFELSGAGLTCTTSCRTTIDATLNERLRRILQQTVAQEQYRNVHHGAIVVLDARDGSLLALVGSPDPSQDATGNQINMSITPRPIGSTIKPFIYAKGFADGLRPYTLVNDTEYRYPIATGFSLYPQNYDGQFRGEVTLHEALSNSLNVPSVKVLEYIGLDSFYRFLAEDMAFTPIQDFDQYQYGIALGGLEMDLLTLSHYFTALPNKGTLRPLRTHLPANTDHELPPQSAISRTTELLDPASFELVHTILNDRLTGVAQFGRNNNLRLPLEHYGVKTGTSRDFHDSWVVGYTPDFVVGVWLGNTANEPLQQVSGQAGAGQVWQAVMEHMLETPYHQNTPYDYTYRTSITLGASTEWGLPDDQVNYHRTLLEDPRLIRSPHPEDTFRYLSDGTIPLTAKEPVEWFVNDDYFATGQAANFIPPEPGTYTITAQSLASGEQTTLTITVTTRE